MRRAIAVLVTGLVAACTPRGAELPDRGPNISGLVVSTGLAEPNALAAGVRRHLAGSQWDSLELMARDLWQTDTRFTDGTSKLRVFYAYGAGAISDKGNPLAWPRQIRQLRAWTAERPRSAAARIALAAGLHGYAWEARGTGFASTVSDSAAAVMEERLRELMTSLAAAAELEEPSPGWFQVALHVSRLVGIRGAAYDSLYNEAVARYPGFEAYYLYRSINELPRWGGAPGAMEAHAARASDGLGGSAGDQLYARMAWYLADAVGSDDLFKQHTLSWPRIRTGFADLITRHPGAALQFRSQLAFLAFYAGDSTEARTRMSELANQVDLSVWENRERFAYIRDQLLPPAAAR